MIGHSPWPQRHWTTDLINVSIAWIKTVYIMLWPQRKEMIHLGKAIGDERADPEEALGFEG